MKWETFPHQADVGVRGIGDSPADAFIGAALAMCSVVCDPASVSPMDAVSIECAAPDVEILLVDWLNRLIYEMATRRMLFSRFDIAIQGSQLKATAWGETVSDRHHPAVEPKGASYCELKVVQSQEGSWVAQCVVDV